MPVRRAFNWRYSRQFETDPCDKDEEGSTCATIRSSVVTTIIGTAVWSSFASSLDSLPSLTPVVAIFSHVVMVVSVSVSMSVL